MRLLASSMIFVGSDHVLAIADNSFCRMCSYKALRRLAGVAGAGYLVVDREDRVLGDVGAFGGDFALGVFDFGVFDVFAPDDGKGFDIGRL